MSEILYDLPFVIEISNKIKNHGNHLTVILFFNLMV